MSPMAWRYKWVWKRLKQKFFPKPSIFLVHGRFRVAHEGGYDWTVGYCTTRQKAEEMLGELERQLKAARARLGQLHGISESAYEKRNKYWLDHHSEGYEEHEEYKLLTKTYFDANNLLRDEIDIVMETMLDQDIPFPYSHLLERSNGMDGPLEYHIEEIIECPAQI